MKFIAGNIEFIDNIKQLMPDMTIFDRIILEEPTILSGKIWRKQLISASTGLTSGSIRNDSNDVMYRSCYLIYKSGPEINKDNISMILKNVFSNEVTPSFDFKTWGLVQVDANMYALFVWIDIEQEYTFKLNNANQFNNNDWCIQVVI